MAAVVGSLLAVAADGEVVGLRPAGGEDDLVRARADEFGHLAPRAVNGRPRLLPVEVDARRVAELLGQVRQHRLDDPAVNRGRRTVVEIDAAHKKQWPVASSQ